MEALISFKEFSFRYESQAEASLHDINVDIYPNEKILVLGPSGSGKSTFGRCINGLIPEAYPGQVTGDILLKGKTIFDHSIGQLSYQVGTVLQDSSAQFVGLTVAEDVAFALENDGRPNLEMRQEVAHWADLMNLQDLLAQSPQDLSGGQKQRVSMAGVMIDSPDILLFDEPLANLDPSSGYATMALIDRVHKALGTTIIIIEHRLEDALSQDIDRVLVFDQGRIVYNGSPDALLKSKVLDDLGIRVPLYVSALDYAGLDLDQVQNLSSIDRVNHPDMEAKLLAWNQGLSFPDRPKKSESLLRLEGVDFSYPLQDRLNLNNIDLEIMRGQMISVVGTNGAGKTTLARMMAGFIRPDSGRLFWQDQDISQQSIIERADKIGYVMQDPNQMISQHMIFDEVALGLRLRGYDEEAIEEKVYQALKVCGLYPFRAWPINALSFGQKKRVTIAAILVLKPDLLILDEPTAGQDFRHYQEFMDFVADLNQQGMTILMITHDLQLILEYTQRTLVMSEGQIIADRTPFDVLTEPALTDQASLRPTSLYYLGKKIGLEDISQFMENFIRYEEEVKANE